MKRILSACLLVSLQFMCAAQAYEADIHYSTTYVLAMAAGWSQADALTIASANEGVDANQHTVAALEMDTAPGPTLAGYVTGSLRQAEKNLKFHCFSKTRGQAGQIAADVRKVMSGHFAEVPDHDEDPRKNVVRLIALGVALHCQQDAYSHAGFGGSCGSYPGSCFGHTHQTMIDKVAFRLLGKHYFDPDHPAVSGQHLLETLQGTASELAARRPPASLHSTSTDAVAGLANSLRGSGLELPDELRRNCNRYVAGKWLFDYFRSRGKTRGRPDTLEILAPEIAAICRNPSLASATVVRIPDPLFPRLNADASASLVRVDGSYELLPEEDSEASLPANSAGFAGLIPNYNTRAVKVQLSHWSQLLALPHTTRRRARPTPRSPVASSANVPGSGTPTAPPPTLRATDPTPSA